MKNFKGVPWPHHVDDEKQIVWVYVENGFPTTIGVPYVVSRFHPGYNANLCTKDFLDKLKRESL
tara:strand:+ start:71 stop:262 length:192 start_codon:yes stop_codon:yes gene_type:complete